MRIATPRRGETGRRGRVLAVERSRLWPNEVDRGLKSGWIQPVPRQRRSKLCLPLPPWPHESRMHSMVSATHWNWRSFHGLLALSMACMGCSSSGSKPVDAPPLAPPVVELRGDESPYAHSLPSSSSRVELAIQPVRSTGESPVATTPGVVYPTTPAIGADASGNEVRRIPEVDYDQAHIVPASSEELESRGNTSAQSPPLDVVAARGSTLDLAPSVVTNEATPPVEENPLRIETMPGERLSGPVKSNPLR